MVDAPGAVDTPADASADDSLAAALVCAVVDDEPAVAAPRSLRWLVDVWAAGVDDAPLALVHDLGQALLRGRGARLVAGRPLARSLVDDDDAGEVRAARLAWEDRVVAPWLLDPSFIAAHVVVAGAPSAARERVVAHAVTLAATRALVGLARAGGNVARLRATLARWTGPDRVVNADDLACRVTPAALGAAVVDLRALTDALAGRPLFRDEDLWELSHLVDLPSEAARLALRTMHTTSARVPPASPELVARLRRRARDVPVDDQTPDAFPAGGFDAMSTKGALENLVRSEVGYVGEGASVDPDGRRGPDLFDVRFVEGELLYYTRDESPLFQARRPLVFVVDDADHMRHKAPGLPTQTLVLVSALCLRAHHDLVDALGPAAVHTTFALGGDDGAVIGEEQAVLRLSLHADLAHRRAAIVEVDEAPLVGRVVFSTRPAPATRPADAGRARGERRPASSPSLWVRVGGAKWQLDDGADVVEVDAGDAAGQRAVVDAVLLAGLRR